MYDLSIDDHTVYDHLSFISLGGGLYGFESSGKFIDIGVPEDYYRAQKILKDWFKYI